MKFPGYEAVDLFLADFEGVCKTNISCDTIDKIWMALFLHKCIDINYMQLFYFICEIVTVTCHHIYSTCVCHISDLMLI